MIVDQRTNFCPEGLTSLLAIVRGQQGQMCWIARADDFHFSDSTLEQTAQGVQLITRKMDSMESTPLTMPVTRIAHRDWPGHLR